ncbi:hypothetical protein BDR03DRAFT_950512 [Suillus americanus]|nr:hypothetical protein BDR03DRAFT_950512 [Suillus americanus]
MAVQELLLVLTILASTSIFVLCWGFVIIAWRQQYVILPDSIVDFITGYPTVLTLVSTVVSTILSVISTALLSFAVKKAVNHYITQPISLVKLHTAIALTKSEPLLRWDHYKLSSFTVIFVVLVTLLNSSWTTLLLPTPLLWPVPINGTDLDLGSSAFEAKLSSDLNTAGYYQNGWDLLVMMASMSGTSATRLAVAGGSGSVFSFNGVSYSTTSGGILPAVEDYAGTTSPPVDIGLEYYGGRVAVNTSLKYQGHSGLARNYTMTQQGFSAIVTCSDLSDLDPNQFRMSFNNLTSLVLGSNITNWQWSANCPLGSGSGYWSTKAFWEYDSESAYEGLLGIVVCPGGVAYVDATATSFDIFLGGMGQYSFLNTTVCNVAPYVASFNVTYNQSMISVDQLQHGPIQLLNNSAAVTAFISTVVYQLSISSQTTYNNPLGGLLRLRDSNSSVNDILENYFRGVVEFSATYLRSAYFAEGASASSTMQDLYSNKSAFIPLNGTMFIATYGWDRGRLTYLYILCIFTAIWLVTVSAAVYSLFQECIRPRSCPTFDASNPVHLMVASSAGGLESLAKFKDDGASENEHAQVRLRDVASGDAAGRNTSTRPMMPRFEIVR